MKDLRSDGTYTVHHNGALTRKTDLNLLQEWIFSSPWGFCTPVHISCGHVDNHDGNYIGDDKVEALGVATPNKFTLANLKNATSNASNIMKNGSNDHPCSIRCIVEPSKALSSHPLAMKTMTSLFLVVKHRSMH